jgi:hypothetical protein
VVYVCVCTCVQWYVCVSVCLHACMLSVSQSVSLSVCLSACLYVCMYVCVRVLMQSPQMPYVLASFLADSGRPWRSEGARVRGSDTGRRNSSPSWHTTKSKTNLPLLGGEKVHFYAKPQQLHLHFLQARELGSATNKGILASRRLRTHLDQMLRGHSLPSTTLAA